MRPIILASKSPRRSQLLREAGFEFRVKTFDVEEDFPEDMPVEEVAPFLAEKKAAAARHLIEDREIVLSADSVVILDNVIYNKPADEQEAHAMLRKLSGRDHIVITGVCLLGKEKKVVFSGLTRVWFEELSDAEIEFYIRHFKPFDKAGAYGAQDWIGHCKISRIEGSFQNVMGLPTQLVYEALKAF
jgi:septum formation protein